MNRSNIGQIPEENIFVKYKKWIVAGLGLYFAPTILFFAGIIGYGTYSYFTSEIRWHPYQQYIYGGFNIGKADLKKDMATASYKERYESTIWDEYEKASKKLHDLSLEEKEKYLSQFPQEEHGLKRAELSILDKKFPLELELEKRFNTAIDFYTDYVDKKIKRECYGTDKEYKEALQIEAWKIGYVEGYSGGYSLNTPTFSR